MGNLWITYPPGQESVDRRWIKCLFRGITYGSFEMSIRHVDNLYTGNVYKFESYPPLHTNVEKLSTMIVDNFECHPLVRDAVDNFSTWLVDKSEQIKQAQEMR